MHECRCRTKRRAAGGRLVGGGRRDQVYLLELMAQGTLRAKDLITHRFPLRDLVRVWDEFLDKKQDQYVQAVFTSAPE